MNEAEPLLGVQLQSNLKGTKQVECLSLRLKKRLAGLEKLKFIMSCSVKNRVVQDIFYSVLCYCLPLFGGCSKQELDLLQSQQNKAARIVLGLPPRSNRDSTFNAVKWLSVRQLVAYHTLLAVYRVRHTNEPEYLYQVLSRENHNGHIIMKNVQLSLYRNSFIFRGALLWNKLPKKLRMISQKDVFKKSLRTWVEENVHRFDD